MRRRLSGQLVPLNGLGRYPFSWRLDMGVGYDWAIAGSHKLELQMYVTNLTNRQAVRTRNTYGDNGNVAPDGSLTPNQSFLSVSSLQPPRTTNFVVRYSF